jgi:hypothetical protein
MSVNHLMDLPVFSAGDAGVVLDDNFCRVWSFVYLGAGNPREGEPVDYRGPEALLSDWSID